MADHDQIPNLEVVPPDPLQVPANEVIERAKPPVNSLADSTAAIPAHHMSLWQTKMWGWVAAGLGVSGLLLIALVSFAVYRTTSIVNDNASADLAFTFSSLGMISTTLLRLLAMLIGSGVIFGGLAVSFFSSRDPHAVSVEGIPAAGESFKTMVASHTPGLIGIFTGGVIIIAALFAVTRHDYQSPERWTISTTAGQNTSANGPLAPGAILIPPAAALKQSSGGDAGRAQKGGAENER
ncbi:MAG: hypothetical protein ACN6QE_22355 [Pseudomonas putida]